MSEMPRIVAQLIHIQGPLKGRIQEFSQFPVHIGRHSTCQIRYDKDMTTLSRQHARIERHGNRFRIIDVSTNGTWVNGKRIADVYLRDGDVITFTENGPKASFLTKIGAGDQVAGNIPVARKKPAPSPATPPSPMSDPDLTAGPDLDIPVVSTDAPLEIQHGAEHRSFGLLPVTLGSDPACEVVIDAPPLSGRHAQIFFSDGTYYVKDLSGTRTVTINGRPIGDQAVLAEGAELALTPEGPRFRFTGSGRLEEIQDLVVESSDQAGGTYRMESPGTKRFHPSPKMRSLLKNLFKIKE